MLARAHPVRNKSQTPFPLQIRNKYFYSEEVLGSELVCLNVDTLDDAVDLVNGNEYGNGVAIFMRSGPRAETFRRNIEADHVVINVLVTVPLPVFSFTGNKNFTAGGGDSTFYTCHGIKFYT